MTPVVGVARAEGQALGEGGQHRSGPIPDVVIAAPAELAGLVVLHLDKDFELIASITGQVVARLRM